MAPKHGDLHGAARRDSRAVRLWAWARRQEKPWTADDAAAAAGLSGRRARELVAALHAARLLRRVREWENAGRFSPAAWAVARRKSLPASIVLTVEAGRVTGIRPERPRNAEL